jgi:hypothetical protein
MIVSRLFKCIYTQTSQDLKVTNETLLRVKAAICYKSASCATRALNWTDTINQTI